MRIANYRDFHQEEEWQSMIEMLFQTFSKIVESAVFKAKQTAYEDTE
ncbi:MAG: hypothetical protein AB9903_05570 [Vulcanimicrobiota bacterium]